MLARSAFERVVLFLHRLEDGTLALLLGIGSVAVRAAVARSDFAAAFLLVDPAITFDRSTAEVLEELWRIAVVELWMRGLCRYNQVER